MNTPKSPWRLVTEATGKQIWTLEPRTGLSSSDLSDFGFAKDQNCNSADAVYRSSKVGDAFVPKGSDTIERGWSYLCQLQANSGHWPGDYGGPMFLLPGLVFAAYITESPFAKVEQDLMRQYMLNHQNADGGWGLHIEGQSTMFGTVLQYVALRLLGEPPSARHMLRASVWIKEHGGAVTIPSWGKFYMSLLGLYEWRGNNSLFPEMWLLPEWLPVHPSQYWCHTRMVYLPMAYCAAVRIRIPENELIRKLRSEIHTTQYEYIDWKKARNQCAVTDLYHPHSKLLRMLNRALNLYEATPIKSWREKAKSFILEYINAEDEQTNYINIGPVNQVINSICVWHAYGKESETFRKHRERWSEYLWIAEDGMKMQGYNGSQLWDTAFAFQALYESGISDDFRNNYNSAWEFINRSQVREAAKEHIKYYRHDSVGGWPFSTAPHGWPITDCTAEGLKCMMLAVESDLLSKAEGGRH